MTALVNHEGKTDNGDFATKEESCSELSAHWDQAFVRNSEQKLGWYETDMSPSFRLIESSGTSIEDHICIAGSGNTRLVDALVERGYHQLTASDISQTALKQLEERLGDKVDYVLDDLTQPNKLLSLKPVSLWFDRAVLHFFTEERDRVTYRKLLLQVIKPDGYVALAEFAEDGAQKCSGLDVRRYSIEDMQEFLGEDFHLQSSFRFIYTMPSGDSRPYNYGLFKRVNEPE